MRTRALIVAVLVGAAAFMTRGVGRATAASEGGGSVMARPLDRLPMTIEDWAGRRLADVDEASKRVLGADDYLNRRYVRGEESAVDLFIAFYAGQRQGDAIHSPRNCLPGAGWQPVAVSTVPLKVDEGRTVIVNRYVIEKEHDRRLVYYWYQGRGRVVANEYANKVWLVVDAIRTGRSDGALVRAMVPATHEAELDAKAFVRTIFTPLSQALP
jgi:EpsI family protein